MNRVLSQMRVAVALLLLGLGLVFGLSVAVAGAASCAQPVGVHQTTETAPTLSDDAVCALHGCRPDTAGCCTGVVGGSCGLAALVAPGTLLAMVEINGAEWQSEPTDSLVGLGPQAGRRPPRLVA